MVGSMQHVATIFFGTMLLFGEAMLAVTLHDRVFEADLFAGFSRHVFGSGPSESTNRVPTIKAFSNPFDIACVLLPAALRSVRSSLCRCSLAC